MKIKFNIKKIFLFIGLLFPWLISGILFPYNDNFYSMLNIPSFALPGTIIGVIWIILYILIMISVYNVIKTTNIFKKNDYLYVLITNYVANQLFSFTFFYLMSPFLAFIMTTITFISSIFLYIETKNINKKASFYLIPYIIFSAYAFIVSLVVYIMNF